MAEKNSKALLMLLLLIPFALAQSLASSPYLVIVPVALMITLIVIGLVYMASRAFGSHVLEAWAKLEIQEAFVSVILLVIILGAVTSANTIVSVLTGTTDYMTAAQGALDKQIAVQQSIFLELAELNFYVMKLAGYSYSVSLGLGPVSAYTTSAPRAGVTPLAVSLSMALDQVSIGMLTMRVEKLFLLFFKNFIPTFLLPIALVLRVFPVTRKIGAALIAVSLGAFIVFPASIILGGAVFNTLSTQTNSALTPSNIDKIAVESEHDPGLPFGKTMVCSGATSLVFTAFTIIGEAQWASWLCNWMLTNPVMGAFFIPCYFTIVPLIYQLIVSGFPVALWIPLSQYGTGEGVSDPNIYSDRIFGALHLYGLPAVSASLTLSLVTLLITAIFTVTATKSISVALGGEGQLYGLSKII